MIFLHLSLLSQPLHCIAIYQTFAIIAFTSLKIDLTKYFFHLCIFMQVLKLYVSIYRPFSAHCVCFAYIISYHKFIHVQKCVSSLPFFAKFICNFLTYLSCMTLTSSISIPLFAFSLLSLYEVFAILFPHIDYLIKSKQCCTAANSKLC